MPAIGIWLVFNEPLLILKFFFAFWPVSALAK